MRSTTQVLPEAVPPYPNDERAKISLCTGVRTFRQAPANDDKSALFDDEDALIPEDLKFARDLHGLWSVSAVAN